MRGEFSEQKFVFDSCEPGRQGGLPCLHSRWSARLCGSLGTLHQRMDPIAVSRELEIGNAAPKRLLLGHRAALFIRRVAREFRAAAQMVRKRLKTRGRNPNKLVNGRERAI